MRILHTSDWHLGRDFGSVSLHDDQKAFLDWLVEQVVELKVELVVIAGDLFDRAYAPADAIRLFRDALHKLLDTKVKVAAITGNHDAHDRVANYGGLLDLSGLYLRGGYQAIGEVIALDFADGPLDLVLLPFLDPQGAPDSLG
ncbi:MAG: exonuclease SbcCD subunit D, partial [Actinomycetota bacterium]